MLNPGSIQIRSLVSVVGLVVTLIISVGCPFGYAVSRYLDEVSTLEIISRSNVNRLHAHIHVPTPMWEFQSVRWDELIENPDRQVNHQVFSANGEEIFRSSDHPSWPSFAIQRPIVVNAQEVGSLRSVKSLRPLLIDTSIVASISILFGFFVFVALRVLPLRVLDATYKELSTARANGLAADLAMSNFLAAMNHEIRTPMNGVLGMVGVLMDTDLSAEQRKQVQTIKHSGEALLSPLNNILDVLGIELGQVALDELDFDLRNLLDSIAAQWQPQFLAKKLNFSIQVAPDIATVLKGDPTRIRQILFNLIGNAIKFTEAGGVTVAVSQQSPRRDDHELLFAVSDTGIGVASDDQSRLFSRFSQVDGSVTRKHGGTGLGLAICKQLAELMGGNIGIESAPGRGSTFWFTIRCARGSPKAVVTKVWATENEHGATSVSDRTLRILVAEDNHVNQAVLQAMLMPCGHHIEMVADGLEAVAAVMRCPHDLVLMDVKMPRMDGLTATRKIRGLPGKTGQIPIIALTANTMMGDREKCLDAGMTDYVSKPINPRSLFGAIAKVSRSGQKSASQDAKLETKVACQDVEPDDDAAVLEELSVLLDVLRKQA